MMEERNVLASRVLNSSEFLHYVEMKKAVEANETLYPMILEYEKTTEALVSLMQNSEYDAAEAIRLTNDAEYLSGQIERHPDYCRLVEANDRLQAFLAATQPACGGACATCAQNCHKEQ